MKYTAAILAAAAGTTLVSAQSSTTPVTGKLGDAQVVNDNPKGACYIATLPGTSVKGSVKGTSSANGTGVSYEVNFSNIPTSGGPFLYHIHDQPVPDDGNCTGTLAHLDPTQRGEMPMCDPSMPQTCQVGDLAGKFGKVTADPFSANYVDLYTSTKQGIGAFIGNRSIVFHFANTTRITCASFMPCEGSGSSGSNSSMGGAGGSNVTSPSGPSASSTPFVAGGVNLAAPMTIAVAAGVVAALLL